jgi:hypothetical protein
VSSRKQDIKQYVEFDFMRVLRQAREVQTSVSSQYMAAACCGKGMYLENDRNVCICASSSESDVRNENFKDSMKESEEYFIIYDDQHVFGTSSSASFSIPGTRVCLDAFFCSPRIERCNNSAIALSGHRDSLKKERNPTFLRQILEIEIDSAVMTNQGIEAPCDSHRPT